MQYVYKVLEVVKVTDGDTFWLRLDVGFRQTLLCHIRLDGWDTPELRRGSDFEKSKAKEARQIVDEFLHSGEIWVQTKPDPDNFGRWLANVWRKEDGQSLGHLLSSMELASQWPARWREEFDS